MLEVGSVLNGNYKILNEIGRGGMSVVYLALNERANKTWAVKEVRKDGSTASEVVSQGLIAETEMLKRLNHPNLPSIIDVVDQDESFIIVMDYIEGRSLQSLLDHSGAQDPDMVLKWAKQLCSVLNYLHSQHPPIIYRDMKPANIMLKPSGDVVLIDFGTAREYKEASQGDTTWLGTRGYAAPEQFGGKGQTDARTDIYNLGATLYHLLTGYSPADTHFEILPLDQLNPKLMEHGFVEIVSRCCMSNPEDRYQSDAEVMYALEHIDDVGERARRDRKKKLRRFTAAALTALAGAVGVLAFTLAGNSARAGSYDGYLEAAARASSFSDAASYYEQAVKLKPTDPTAYEQMVNAIQSDFQFTQEENDALFRILNAHNGASRANIDRLASSEEERYVHLAYQIAHQYYFFYEGSDNRAKAAYWYERVQDSEFLSDQERELAKSLCSIGKYYSSLGSTNNDYAIGENAQNYGTFWEDLVSITDGNVVEKTGGAHYAVALYQEFSNQIFNHAREFREFGITKDEMLTQIAKMEAGLRDLGDSGSENVRERIRKTRSNLVNARQTVESAFAAVG